MPALEMAQETGKLLSWRKKEGEHVAKGELLLEVETDKAVVEVESPGEGICPAVKAREGDVIPVGQTIAWLLAAGRGGSRGNGAERRPAGERTAPLAVRGSRRGTRSSPPAPAEVRISPKARRLAKEHGVDISRLRGSGPGGEILAEDILAAAGARSRCRRLRRLRQRPRPASSGRAKSSGAIGRLMAERTTQSWTTVPHFFVTREIDASAGGGVSSKSRPEVEKVARRKTDADRSARSRWLRAYWQSIRA